MKREYTKHMLSLALMLVLASHLPCYAQAVNASEPSLQETLNWLTRKINTYAGIHTFGSGSGSSNKDDCTYEVASPSSTFIVVRKCVAIRVPGDPANSGTEKTTDKITIPLTEIDPRFIEVANPFSPETTKGLVILNTIDRAKAITIERRISITVGNTSQPEQVSTSQQDTASIDFFEQVIARRVAQAFAHAIKESRKAARKNPEPF